MTSHKMRFIASRLRYDALPQLFLDALKVALIRIEVFYLFREGLNEVSRATDGRVPPGFEAIRVGSDELSLLPDYADRNCTRESLHGRLKVGDLCVGAVTEGRIVAMVWARLHELAFCSYRFPLRHDEAYLHDAYTAAEYRGRGLAPFLRQRIYGVLEEQGRTQLYSISTRFNKPAIRLKEKLGAEIIDRGVTGELFHRYRFGCRAHPERFRAPQPTVTQPPARCDS